ncbi:hypothetical protein HSBAA_55470 [Vreelandella sulfidaeris]|uniref:Uncharacterized protein n=1 Tax=Vreelandella sulfidaeris TaxID=115553 RepID=A0A455UHU3_9GAMM|nr:hypothetical protein HSBAA_55470 [Halomonas sulfidaeris]
MLSQRRMPLALPKHTGKGNKWSGSDTDNNAELRALNEALLEPSLKLTPVTTLGAEFDSSRTMSPYSLGRRVPIIQGYWVQLALPASLSGGNHHCLRALGVRWLGSFG